MNFTTTPHILIDTCILQNLVSQHAYNESLRKLKLLAENQKLVILVPATLLKEWDKHKEIKRKKIFDEFERAASTQASVNHPRARYTQAQLERLKTIVDSQITDIDNLLTISGVLIKSEDYPHKLIWEQMRNNKAPFTTGRRSESDAEIIYGSLEFVKSKSIQELFFISSNSADFSVSDLRPNDLHPDYTEAYPNVQIYYFRNTRTFFSKVNSLGIEIPETRFEFAKDPQEMNSPFIDRSEPILDQLYSYLQEFFSELSIIPPRFFTQQYPFVVNPLRSYHRSPFTLVTDNIDLYELLQIKVSEDTIEDVSGKHIKSGDDEEKIRFVFNLLKRNHISRIALKNEKSIELSLQNKSVRCDCSQCKLFELNWAVALDQCYGTNNASETSITSKFKKSYLKYQLGDFKGSAIDFEDIFGNDQTTAIQKFICVFNLRNLSRLLEYEFHQENDVYQLLGRINAIDIGRIKNETIVAKPILKNLIEWIDSKQFYTEANDKIRQYNDSMRDHYYSRGGGNTEYTSAAIETYVTTDDFLNINYIIYNKFYEYTRLSRTFTELLCSSYACSRHLGGKLRHFPDYLLEKLIINTREGAIRRFAIRFELTNADYHHDTQNRFELFAGASAFFFNLQKISDTPYFDKGYYYNDQLNSISINILQVLQIIDLKNADLDTVAAGILTYLKESRQTDFRLLEELKNLILQKGKHFPFHFFDTILLLISRKQDLHHEGLCHAVCQELENRFKYTITDDLFKFAIASLVDKCPECNRVHSVHMLADVFNIMSEHQKKTIKELLVNKMDKQFNAHTYYLTVMMEMMDFNTNYHSQYTQYVQETVSSANPRPTFLPMREYAHPTIDEYLNYHFKFKVEIPDELRNKITEISKYYQWLLSPDDFDYNHFESEWLTVHFTINYKAWLKQSEALRKHMINKLWNSKDLILEKKLLSIYVMPSALSDDISKKHLE